MVTREQVLHVARLARLSLTGDEAERFAPQLARILEYVDLLSQLDDAPGVPDGDSAPPVNAETRADEPGPCLPRDRALGLAPRHDDETFLVPPVLDGGGAA
jgi:aspartyl-tRNA(Asn)/glutamyl-tRNA(Gln) amidotransferase subunit C